MSSLLPIVQQARIYVGKSDSFVDETLRKRGLVMLTALFSLITGKASLVRRRLHTPPFFFLPACLPPPTRGWGYFSGIQSTPLRNRRRSGSLPLTRRQKSAIEEHSEVHRIAPACTADLAPGAACLYGIAPTAAPELARASAGPAPIEPAPNEPAPPGPRHSRTRQPSLFPGCG